MALNLYLSVAGISYFPVKGLWIGRIRESLTIIFWLPKTRESPSVPRRN